MTLFEKIKETKRVDYAKAYAMSQSNSLTSKKHEGTVTFYAVTGEFIKFNLIGLD
jgi:hypothetical protein